MATELVAQIIRIHLLAVIEVAVQIIQIELITRTIVLMEVQILQTIVIMDQCGVAFVTLYIEVVENVEVN